MERGQPRALTEPDPRSRRLHPPESDQPFGVLKPRCIVALPELTVYPDETERDLENAGAFPFRLRRRMQ